jgi:uncharacterized small protein (DUF1192 family)
MSGETEEEARAPSRAGSMASSMFSGRTAESSYATEALSAEMKAELVNIILYRKMTGTMRESRTLVRSVNACQRAEAALLLVEVATSALDEIAEGDIPQGSVGQKDEMMFLQEIQQRDSKLLEMNVRCEEAEALRHEAENTILEMSVRCEEAEALRQEAENAVLEMSVRCEVAEKMRSECEHVLKLGAEQEERIALLQAEIARMQKERMESTADDAKDLAGNLRKEILDLQAKYQQVCESACALQSRLESIQGIHESVGCQNEGDIQRGFARLQELEKSEQSIQECFTSFECKSVEEMRNVVIALKAERDVQETLLETFRKQYEEAINSASAAHAKSVEQREESSNFEDGVDLSPAKKGDGKARDSTDADSGPDGESAPMCALKECNKSYPWDAKGGKYWKFCTPAHNQKAKEKDQHVACPASIISVHDPQMHAEQILAGTSAYVTQVVPPPSWAQEGLMAQAAELAQTIFDEAALADIDWGEADDVEELGTVILFAAFEQVSGRMTTTMDQQNIALAWKPGLLSAQDVAEIYTGTQAQEIAWLYNALVEAVRARCARMQQEKASQIELERICAWDKIKMGQDLGTKMEITRIAEEDRIECQVYGVLCEMIEQIVTQVAPAEEKSHEVVVRLQTYAEQAWEALKVERERKTKAAVAHAAMLKAHSEARERKIREKHERQMCRELVLAIVSDVSNCVEACEPRDVDEASKLVAPQSGQCCTN